MRVALLLSGKFRDSKRLFTSVKENILDIYNPDVFISTWDNQEEIGDGNYESIYPQADCSSQEIIDFYKPVEYESELFLKSPIDHYLEIFGKTTKNVSPNSITDGSIRWFSMWYKKWKSNNLKKQKELREGFVYDLVIMSRFDLEFLEPVFLQNDNHLLKIAHGYDFHGGLGDLFFYSDSKIMDSVCNIFPFYCDVLSKNLFIPQLRDSSHISFLRYLQSKKINFGRFWLKFKLRQVEVWKTEVTSPDI